MKIQAIIAAAGMGERLGKSVPKALVPVKGIPLLVHTLRSIDLAGIFDNAVILFPPGWDAEFKSLLNNFFAERSVNLVKGGDSRQASVVLGLECIDDKTEIVVIHDAARPFVSTSVIQNSIDAAAVFGAATVAVPAVDTILESSPDCFLVNTPDRSVLWACQTPQTFRLQIIKNAHEFAMNHQVQATDDATLVRLSGNQVKLVRGNTYNFKVTTPTDLLLAEVLIEKGIL